MADAIDPRERFSDWDEAGRQTDEGNQAQMMTAFPAIIKKHDVDKNTVHVQIAVKRAQVTSKGVIEWKEIPVLEDVPLHYPSGGGATMTFPVKEGDEGLVIFSSRSIDAWWQQGGVQNQTQSRMHDLSDGFFIPGFRSQPKKLSGVSKTTFQLRTDDGSSYFDFDPENKKIHIKMGGDVTFESTSTVTVKAPTVNVAGEGTVTISGAKVDLVPPT